MKKYLVIIIGLISIILNGCKDESFEVDLYQPVFADIDSIALSTGSSSLIANGQAKLNFFVDLYRTVRYAEDDFDSYVLIDKKKLPTDAIKIVDENNQDVGTSFSTTDIGSGTKTFRAEIDGMISEAKTITLREESALPPKIYVNVIFHVLEYNPDHEKFDPNFHKEMDVAKLQKAIDEMNNVFNNQLSDGPNGASANIEFRLATELSSSTSIDPAGYKRVYYDDSWITDSWRTVFAAQDFIDKFDSAPNTYIYNQNDFLNIYILPLSGGTFIPDNPPLYQNVDNLNNNEGLAGMGSEILVGDPITDYKGIEKDGLLVSRGLFFADNDRIELARSLGLYYGLKAPYSTSNVPDDYCLDTRKYNHLSDTNFRRLDKYAFDDNKFRANNILDIITAPSLRNTVTADQVSRIRYAFENCPGRLHGKSN